MITHLQRKYAHEKEVAVSSHVLVKVLLIDHAVQVEQACAVCRGEHKLHAW